MKTTDNLSYYQRHTPIKHEFIKDFVKNKLEEINIIYDVGCNNGDISYPLQKKYGLDVYGIDLSDDLKIPKDYNFNKVDIVKDNNVFFNDCTLFLSLYHHILGAYGLEVADDIFYKLLLRTKYLIFDSGNLSEIKRKDTYWYKKQKNIFNNEKELLDHFGIKYKILGHWNVGGGNRSVVMFHSDDLNNKFHIMKTYKRLIGSVNQSYGLIDVDNVNTIKKSDLHDNLYYKLFHNNKTFFFKKT